MNTRSKLIIGALALATLVPTGAIVTTTDAAARNLGPPLGGKYTLRSVLNGPNRVYVRFLHDRGTNHMTPISGTATAMRSSLYGAFRIR
jgi:hypothetical protein